MGAIVAFSYPTWIARYPEFASVPENLADLYFAEATLYHANDGSGPVQDAGQQLLFLNMLTAQVAQLNATVGGVASSPIVGRINSATEGTVSVGAEMPNMPTASAWYQQTKYGLAYWAATARYRTARYIRGPQRFFGSGLRY
jgi:hypothetical protein